MKQKLLLFSIAILAIGVLVIYIIMSYNKKDNNNGESLSSFEINVSFVGKPSSNSQLVFANVSKVKKLDSGEYFFAYYDTAKNLYQFRELHGKKINEYITKNFDELKINEISSGKHFTCDSVYTNYGIISIKLEIAGKSYEFAIDDCLLTEETKREEVTNLLQFYNSIIDKLSKSQYKLYYSDKIALQGFYLRDYDGSFSELEIPGFSVDETIYVISDEDHEIQKILENGVQYNLDNQSYVVYYVPVIE